MSNPFPCATMPRTVNSNEIYVDSFDNFGGTGTHASHACGFHISQSSSSSCHDSRIWRVFVQMVFKTQPTRAANSNKNYMYPIQAGSILHFFMDLVYLFDSDIIGARVCVCPRLRVRSRGLCFILYFFSGVLKIRKLPGFFPVKTDSFCS